MSDFTVEESTEYFRLIRLYRDRKRFLGFKGKYKFSGESKSKLLNLILKRLDYYARNPAGKQLEVYERYDKENAEKIRSELEKR